MPERPLLLVTDGRWPLDADGARVARELELATGAPVSILRVPDGHDAYRLISDDDAAVIVVATAGEAAQPPVGWTRPVCWHVAEGCAAAWNIRVNATSSISEFVAATGPTAWSEAGWACPVCGVCGVTALGLLALLLLIAARRRATGPVR